MRNIGHKSPYYSLTALCYLPQLVDNSCQIIIFGLCERKQNTANVQRNVRALEKRHGRSTCVHPPTYVDRAGKSRVCVARTVSGAYGHVRWQLTPNSHIRHSQI